MKTLSVIIPRFVHDKETDDITYRTIELVRTHRDKRFNTTITVVDDGSSIEWGHDRFDDVDIIQHEKNRGIAVAWNDGWKGNHKADFFCWLNADCFVTVDWSYPLVVAAEKIDCIAMPYTNGVKSDNIGITGWCFLTSNKVATNIGYFDETFVPAQYEDTDWFHRAIYQHHIPLVNVPSSNVIHERMKGGTAVIKRFEYLHMANRYRYGWKHGVDVNEIPPFWKKPLPEVTVECSLDSTE